MLPRVIVIGAGASGISAASRLMENGFTNIQILEAENRIGGRIFTTNFGDSIVDLGAQNVPEHSIVHTLVKDLNLLQLKTSSIQLYHSKHGLLSDRFTNALIQSIYALYNQSKSPVISWKQHFLKQYQQIINQTFKNDNERKLVEDNLDFIENALLLNTGLFSLSDGGQPRAELPLSFKLCWNDQGFQQFLNVLMSKDKNIENKIFLNNGVTKIDWKNDNGDVRVTCNNGNTYSADVVIVTIPLGALKQEYKTMFSPRLPERKEKTIELLGASGVLKILFHFTTKWWSNHDLFFSWGQEDLAKVDFEKGPSQCGKSWVTSLVGFYIHPDNSNILTALFAGGLSPEIELTDEDILLDGIYYVTQKFLGSVFEDITRPDKIKCFNWYSNPHFRCTTSVETLESKCQGLNGGTLAEPVFSEDGKIKLLFAGEAANDFVYGTVNGAVLSGFREADRIIDSYKR